MASTFTTSKHLEKPANGDYVDDWDVPVNADWDAIDVVFGGSTAINVVGISGTTTLTFTQYRPQYFIFSGLLTANVNYQLPTGVGGAWTLLNLTTGAFTVTFSSAGGGTSVLAPRNSYLNVRSDGTNIFTVAAAPGANSDITSLLSLGLTGLLKGQGAGAAVIAATAGADYAAPAVDTVFSAKQTFSSGAAELGAKLFAALEKFPTTVAPATGTILFDVLTQGALRYSLNATGNWTLNIRGDSTHSFDSLLAVDESITITLAVKQGSPAFYNNVVKIDGTTLVDGTTIFWQGVAPTAGGINGHDVYSFAIQKPSAGTFVVFASLVSFT